MKPSRQRPSTSLRPSRPLTAAAIFVAGASIFAAAVGVGAQQPAAQEPVAPPPAATQPAAQEPVAPPPTAPQPAAAQPPPPQPTTAAAVCQIKGTIVGLNVPLPGVAITAKRGETVQTATSTGLDGTYTLNLPDASYQLSIDLTGFDRVERELTVSREAGCPQPLDLTLALSSRASTQAAATGRAAGDGPNGAQAGGANAAAQPGQPQAGGRAGGRGRFETLQVTEDSDVAGVDTRTFEVQAPAADNLLPPGFGSEALADAIAITGDGARVDRGQLNDRRDAFNRGEFNFNDQRGGDGGFGGNPTLAGIGGDQGFAGRGGRGGNNNNFQLGGRGGRQNRIQGNFNYRFEGSALNAAPRQLRSELAGTEQPYNNQTFSGQLGGPLKIPGILPNTNNSSQIRVNFSTTRGGNAFDQYATVPTDAMRAGDFSASTIPLIDPTTGTAFENNQIPVDRLSPQALALLQYYPAANLSGNTRNYHYSTSSASTNNQFQVQFQHNFSGQAAGGGRNGGAQSNAGRAGRGQRLLTTRTNVNMNVSFQYQQADNDQLNVFTTLGGRRESSSFSVPLQFQVQRGRVQHRFGVTYNHSSSETMNRFSGFNDVANSIGIQGVSQDPFAWGLPRLSFSSISGLSDVTPSLQTADRYSANYTWRRPVGRSHSVQFGGDFRYDTTTTNTESNANGSFVFTGLYTSGGGQLGGLTGFDFADFLLGMPQQASIQYGPGETTLTGRTMGLFVQDDWRMLPNLTMQLGVRYDLLWPYVEENGQLVNIDVTDDFTAAAPVEAGQTGLLTGVAYPAALIQTDTNNVSPKVAAAWRAPTGLVVNTSYEVNYNSGTYSGIARQLAQQPPFATTGTNIGSLSTALLMESALTGIPISDTRNNYGIDPDYVLGLVQQSVINVSRDIWTSYQVSANYTHTRGSNLEIVRAPNRDADGLRIEGVQPFTWTTAEGRSVLNSASFQLQKRDSGGIGYSLTYTLAKSRDNSPSIGGGGGGTGNIAQNDQDIDSEWGLSNFDQRHRFQAQLRFDLPFGQGRRFLNNGGFGAGVLDRWRLTANFSADSGRPRTVTVRGASRDIASGVNGALRADYTGLPLEVSDPTIDKYFNTDAFTIPAAGAFGSSSRNVIVGPGSKNLNLNIQRNVALGSNRNVQITVGISNVLNLANYTGVDTNVNSPTFGQITGISQPRRAQLQLQFRY